MVQDIFNNKQISSACQSRECKTKVTSRLDITKYHDVRLTKSILNNILHIMADSKHLERPITLATVIFYGPAKELDSYKNLKNASNLTIPKYSNSLVDRKFFTITSKFGCFTAEKKDHGQHGKQTSTSEIRKSKTSGWSQFISRQTKSRCRSA